MLIVGLVSLVILLAAYFLTANHRRGDNEPLVVIQKYIQASYARDIEGAYRLISLPDQKVKNNESYVQEKGAYNGFTLQLAKQLAAGMYIDVVTREQTSNRAQVKVRFKLPAPEDLSSRVFDWDSDKLNSLSPTQQQALLENLEKLKRDRKLAMVDAQETFELIKEGDDWRLFFDWGSGVKVAFGFSAPPSSGIEAQFLEKHVITRIGEPFQIVFKISGPKVNYPGCDRSQNSRSQ